jgi:hypothetical protein
MPRPRAMRWLSTEARTCAPKRVFSNPTTSNAVTTSATTTRKIR